MQYRYDITLYIFYFLILQSVVPQVNLLSVEY